MRLAILALLTTASAWACSCIPGITPCSMMKPDSAVFIARVIRDSGRGLTGPPARIAIEEVIQNVPQGLTETDLYTSSGTTCEVHVTPGDRLIIISGANGGRYGISVCSPGIRLDGNEDLLDALRAQARGGPTNLLGSVYKLDAANIITGPLSGVRVTADGPGGKHETLTGAGGNYRFTGLQSGRYKVSLNKERFTIPAEDSSREVDVWNSATGRRERLPANEVIVAKGACTERYFTMQPAGIIEGAVHNADGQSVAGLTVEAFAFDKRGQREPLPFRSGVTDAEGRYRIQPLPSGRFEIGVNGRKYDDASPYPPAFHDGPIDLAEAGAVSDVDLVVGTPRQPAQLTVTVLSPDGRPFPNALVRIFAPDGTERKRSEHQSNKQGQASLPVYLGEHYLVKATGFSPKVRDYEGEAELQVTDANPVVAVRLLEP